MILPGSTEKRELTSPEERSSALEKVLSTATLARSEQLRSFLRYVGELEIAGRGSEISEYSIGVNALGRPAGFSPSEDSTVRTRAHLLRQKLQDIYDRDLKDEVIRIELPKGSYVPRFVHVEPKEVPVFEPTTAPPGQSLRRLALLILASFMLGVGGTALFFRITAPDGAGLDPVIRDAWGPLVAPKASVLICISNPVNFTVRPLESGDPPPWYVRFPEMEELRLRFAKLQPYWKHSQLWMEFNENSTRFGEAFALAKASRILGAAGAQTEIQSTRALHSPAFNGRNLILLGTPEFSGVARSTLDRTAFTLAWDAKNQDLAVVEKPEANGTAHSFLPVRSGGGRGTVDVSYGLLTVLPSEGSAGAAERTVIISGATSAGSHAAMEYFSSVQSLTNLARKFRDEGVNGFPPAYQVVVRCSSANDHLLSFDYAAHRVLDPRTVRR